MVIAGANRSRTTKHKCRKCGETMFYDCTKRELYCVMCGYLRKAKKKNIKFKYKRETW